MYGAVLGPARAFQWFSQQMDPHGVKRKARTQTCGKKVRILFSGDPERSQKLKKKITKMKYKQNKSRA